MALLLIIGCFLYGVLRFLYSKNTELFICILIWVNFDCFYMIPKIGDYDNYPLTLYPSLSLILAELIVRRKIKFGDFSGVIVILYCILLFLGTITAGFNGQPLILGIKAIKFHLLILFFFLVTSQSINMDKFCRYILIMSLALISYLLVDMFILSGKLLFVDAQKYEHVRSGRMRFTIGYYLIAVACLISFVRLLKKKSMINGFVFFILSSYIFLIIQTRMLILGIILSCLFLTIILKNKSGKMIISMVLISFLAIPSIFLMGNLFLKIGVVEQTITDIEKKRGSYMARIMAYDYYIDKIMESPFWGYGHENFNWKKNTEQKLMEKGIHKSDIGITHFFYENGLLGMFWFLAMTGVAIKKNWVFRKKLPELMPYFILSFSIMLTLDFFFLPNTILFFTIFFGLLSRMQIQERPEKMEPEQWIFQS